LRALFRRRRCACRYGGGARFGHLLKDRRLVRRISLDGLDEVRDEVVTPLELDVDVSPGLLHALTQRDEAVVGRDEEEGEHPEDDKDDDDFHGPSLEREASRTIASASFLERRLEAALARQPLDESFVRVGSRPPGPSDRRAHRAEIADEPDSLKR